MYLTSVIMSNTFPIGVSGWGMKPGH